jgi:hypothetical protein
MNEELESKVSLEIVPRKQHGAPSSSTSIDSHHAVMMSLVRVMSHSCARCTLAGAAMAKDTADMRLHPETMPSRSFAVRRLVSRAAL